MLAGVDHLSPPFYLKVFSGVPVGSSRPRGFHQSSLNLRYVRLAGERRLCQAAEKASEREVWLRVWEEVLLLRTTGQWTEKS